MRLMNGKFFVVLIQQNQLLIFQRMNILLRILAFFFHFASCKKGWHIVSTKQVTFTFLDVFNLIVLFVFSLLFQGLGCYGIFLDTQTM
jgi:hypothetical protein